MSRRTFQSLLGAYGMNVRLRARLTTSHRRLKTRSRETYAKFPPCIQYHPDILLDKTLRGPTLYARTVTHLEYLENLFLLERLMIKHGGGNMQDLIDISCDMLDLTLVWWKHSNRFAGMHSDLEWLVS